MRNLGNRMFTADFETTVNLEETRVWAYGLCEIGNTENFIYGNNIADFINFCKNKQENYVLYFHNLKFDGEFIFHYLLSNNYTFIKDRKMKKDRTFTALISSDGKFYSIEIYFTIKKKGKEINKVTIYDSLKIYNFSVEKVAKAFNLPISKLEIDYKKERKKGYQLTNEEIKYLENDVKIMALAMEYMINQDFNKMTLGSNALFDYKNDLRNFDKYFPKIPYEIDELIRRSYKGGFTYLNPLYQGVINERGTVYDVNSLYPSVMMYENMPFSNPIAFKGKYEEDRLYPLYIQNLSCSFKIKDGKIPTIQLKNNISFRGNEYLESSNDEIVVLTLTNIDLDLFFEHYEVYDIIYNYGWKFKQTKGLFTNYIEKWTKLKIESKKENNMGMYVIAKLFLNSLYGKFGLNPNIQSKYPILNEDGIVQYKLFDPEVRDSLYVPVASFITAYARNKTIRTSQKIRDYSLEKYGKDLYVYSDTDSIHSLIEDPNELKDIIEIDDYKLGFWSHEATFTRSKFLRQKCYIEEIDGKINVTVAGLPKNLSDKVNFDNFEDGFTCFGKLSQKHVKGGIVFVDTTFTIK